MMNLQTLFTLEGKTALITGGSRGVGAMIAEGLVAHRPGEQDSVPFQSQVPVQPSREMLLHDEAYRAKLPGLLTALQEAGSTDLGPHIQPYLGKSFEELTADWQAFCKRTY